MLENLYLIPFTTRLRTQGYSRTLVLDIYKQKISFIPNLMNEILIQFNGKQIFKIFETFPTEDKEYIIKYLEFINKNNLAYFGEKEEVKLFRNLSYEWDFPSEISNSIIEISNISDIGYENIIQQLNEIGCFYILFCFFENADFGIVEKYIKYANRLSFHTITLLFEYKLIKDINLFELSNQYKKINTIIIYNSLNEEYKYLENLQVNIIYRKSDNYDCCSTISPNNFSKRIEHYTESLHYNTCLNRKLCIDVDGNIKNCPNMKKSFGNIKDTTLAQSIEKQDFKDLWHIKKDDIEVCKDCEFRHICTDCRAFIKDPNNIYSHSVKCPYNPYLAKWQGEEGYVPVEECGTYSKETGFVPDAEKIKKLNAKIWGE